jgi:hypothetical protein
MQDYNEYNIHYLNKVKEATTMAMTKQYSTDMLQAGDTFIVRGKTSYPRLTHIIDGEELQDEIKRATQQGRIPTTTPHVYTNLIDATIEYANPNAPTLAECYAAERIYINKDGKQCFSAVRKAQTLPDYGVVDQTDYTKVQGIYLDPEKAVANDLDVKCYFRVYDTKAGMHKGISLDAIVFQEPVKYYEFNNVDSQLAARGLTWTPPVGEAPTYTAPTQPAYAAPVPTQQPVPQATPQAAYGAPIPATQPAYAAPQPQTAPIPQQAAYGAPVPTPQPVQQPVPQPQTAYAAQQQVAPVPQPQQAPYTPGVTTPQADPYAGNAPQPQAAPVQQQAAPQQTIGNAGGNSAFDSAYRY